MKHNESSKTARRRSLGSNIWRIIGGAALVIVAVGVIKNIPDIQRYMRMRAM
jgi:hypothetical protein